MRKNEIAEKKKISVIVPVYNTEEYLVSCVGSITSQSWGDIEIILVDDGSGKAASEMCDTLALEDDRIKVIHKKNEGLAAARETGVNSAEGKWIFFLDSDDELDGADALALLVGTAEKTGADITVGNYRRIMGGEKTGIKEFYLPRIKNQRTVKFRFYGFIRDGHLAYAWGKLYRADFLRENGIHHTSFSFTEDKPFNMKCYLAGASYAFVDASVCCYRVNEKSITFSYKKDFCDVWLGIAREFEELQNRLPESEQMGDLLSTHLLLGFYYYAKQEICAGQLSGKEVRENLKAYMCNPLVQKYSAYYQKRKCGREFESRIWEEFFNILARIINRKKAGVAYCLFKVLLAFNVESNVSKGQY